MSSLISPAVSSSAGVLLAGPGDSSLMCTSKLGFLDRNITLFSHIACLWSCMTAQLKLNNVKGRWGAVHAVFNKAELLKLPDLRLCRIAGRSASYRGIEIGARRGLASSLCK